jgi:hypothetical protein
MGFWTFLMQWMNGRRTSQFKLRGHDIAHEKEIVAPKGVHSYRPYQVTGKDTSNTNNRQSNCQFTYPKR